LFRRKGVFLQSGREGLGGVEGVGGGQGSATESMGEGLGGGFLGGRGREGVLGFRGGGCGGEEGDFVGDGVGEVEEGFAEVRGVVVSFVRVLGSDGKELGVDLLQGVDTLLKLDIVGGKLGLVFSLTELFAEELTGASSERGEGGRNVLPEVLELGHVHDGRWNS